MGYQLYMLLGALAYPAMLYGCWKCESKSLALVLAICATITLFCVGCLFGMFTVLMSQPVMSF